jgi:PAS domain S-box-containing protein
VTADELLQETAEELFEEAPCGYLTTRLDGTIVRVNRTFERWTGHRRQDLLGSRFQDLLSPGGQIYHETHFAPLLHMQGTVREIALDVVRADGTRLPALVNSVVRHDAAGAPQFIRTSVFDATERRRYERELMRARDQEHEVALELQRSLLDGDLPRTEDLEIDVAYRPGVKDLQVGGDWYDAFWLEPDRRAALVVGDVVGRGLGAAATMGQLRSAVRALASTGRGPAELLASLDSYARRHDVGQMATVVYLEVEVLTGEVRFACAGHPPPVVLEPERPARYVWDGRSVPLDAFGTAGAREDGHLRLASGGCVVLYSDGLVERRDRALPDGMDALLSTLDDLARAGRLEADEVARVMAVEPQASDDVCVLTARVGRRA